MCLGALDKGDKNSFISVFKGQNPCGLASRFYPKTDLFKIPQKHKMIKSGCGLALFSISKGQRARILACGSCHACKIQLCITCRALSGMPAIFQFERDSASSKSSLSWSVKSAVSVVEICSLALVSSLHMGKKHTKIRAATAIMRGLFMSGLYAWIIMCVKA